MPLYSFIIVISHTSLVKKTQYFLPRNSYKLFFTKKKKVAFRRKEQVSIRNKYLGRREDLSFFVRPGKFQILEQGQNCNFGQKSEIYSLDLG